MATRTKGYRPGRTLVAYFAGLAILFGLVALGGAWKPELGLDLQGGTRITLIAKGNPDAANLEEARKIIDQRVNGSGVSEAEVVTEGSGIIVVEIPGENRRDLVETVERQAQLRFRLVALSAQGVGAQPTDPTTPDTPGDGVLAPPKPTPSTKPGDGKTGSQSGDEPGGEPTATPKNRVPYAWADGESPTPSDPPATPSDDSTVVVPSDGATGGGGEASVDDPLQWMNNPGQQWTQKFNEFTCPPGGAIPVVDDNPAKPLITCDESGQKFLLSKAMIEGTALDDANTAPPDQSNTQWRVQLQFDGPGTKTFTTISQTLFNTQKQFAIVLDGNVISAPTMNGLITDGQAEISGDFTQTSADSLATSLKFGALPISFEDPSTETIGPSLAGDQLTAGLTAGAVGLGLVLIYCLLYYRGLGLVVVASLLVAAATTYALVLLLSKTAGFTLTLPGIAGLIIAVGITADSFIIFFERIRDEMREGKSMRVAVETGWKRAKVTRLAAQVVSLLSAAVLYIFATGVVKGFGFALGLTTIVDLAILFWFTKPMVSWLARFRFFNSGHRLSGLSTETLGMDPAPVGGKA
ncbi:protein translocase subunit SecD [Nocardioides sp. LHG3406-4]|uniref:protein translocase subunit SecD n=1 Tax=Nocardioides sp. LHG3406-4 TaxID=2804575 RepID=UPI003CFB6376